MGRAKQRAKEIESLKASDESWRSGLTEEEKQIVLVAERLYERLVLGRRFSGGCYHLAFFMTRYLNSQGIMVKPVVGWINDGLWQGVTSHAWVEFKGTKTDVSLCYSSRPEAQPVGDLIVLDHVLRPGAAQYAYYKHGDPFVSSALDWIRQQPELFDLQMYKEREHFEMQRIASEELFDAYLANAPIGSKFQDIARLINL